MLALRPRLGFGLAESLVSLALAGVVMAAASRGLAQHLRLRRERDDQARSDEVVQVVRDVLRAELRHAAPTPQLLGDTAVQLASARVIGVACDQSSTALVIPAAAGWWSAPRFGDSLAVLDTVTGAEWRTTVGATVAQRASLRCPQGGTRIAVTVPPSAPARVLPVRIWRVVRYMAYRAGDGSWWLGERTCTPGCGSAQPVAGPLRPPSRGGLRLALVLDSGGRPVALDLSAKAAIGSRSSSVTARLPLAALP